MPEIDLPIFIDPPDVLFQQVVRTELRDALRLAKKFGNITQDTEAFFYFSEDGFYFEAGSYRRTFAGSGDWSGCVSLCADLIIPFWNSLPKGAILPVRYERGWLSLGSLSVGRAVWQPKYDPHWIDN